MVGWLCRVTQLSMTAKTRAQDHWLCTCVTLSFVTKEVVADSHYPLTDEKTEAQEWNGSRGTKMEPESKSPESQSHGPPHPTPTLYCTPTSHKRPCKREVLGVKVMATPVSHGSILCPYPCRLCQSHRLPHYRSHWGSLRRRLLGLSPPSGPW